MRKKTTLTRVFMALILTLTMMVSSTTVFAAEATTENGDQQVITADNENASAVETRAQSQIVTNTFKASSFLNKPVTTTYVNSVIYVSVSDSYNSSNTYTVILTTPNGTEYTKRIKGNGSYIEFGRFFLSGQYNIFCSMYDGSSINQKVTVKVKFSNEL